MAAQRSTHSCCDIVFIACDQLHVEEAELRIDGVELVHCGAQLWILLLVRTSSVFIYRAQGESRAGHARRAKPAR